MHLIIDGYITDPKKTQDMEFIYEFLDTYPQQIEMTKVSTPQVAPHQTTSEEEHGISGFVLLAESHISVHVYPESAYINIDIFSCKEFDSEQATRTLQQRFGLDGVRSYTLDRPYPDIG